jgi:flavin reductase (DIM6/NTAB) family NADH-FMN oxidoreductase RutF
LKLKLGVIPLIYPLPIVLGGANVHGKPNFELLGDCGLMGINPPIVYISSHKEHYTNIGVMENKTFSINIPDTKMMSIADYCGTVSGHSMDKSTLFKIFYGETGSAPMIEECPVNLECQVVHEFSIKHRQIFVGEVIQTYVGDEYTTEKDGKKGIIDLTNLDPIIYSLDNRYYSIGKPIGIGYAEAVKYKK